MTHFEHKSTDQRGALMVEAIALLGLMTMMSPMVVRQSSERIQEMEDVTVAAQMKNLKDALANYIEANYTTLVPNDTQVPTKKGTISAAQMKPFLPRSYYDDSNNLLGSKALAGDQFKFGYRATCSEAARTDGSGACGTLQTEGYYGDLSASCKCQRYKITGLVLGGSEIPIPEKRASRIASMIGADGGYMRTAAMNEALGGGDAGKVKVLGSQGMWEISDTGDFDINLSDAEKAIGGRIAASTVYSAGRSADYLYRRKVNGIPDANSMFTDLDMGGNGACSDTSGDGHCNRINNSGGLEIVKGKLIIRAKNNAANEDTAAEELTGDKRARVYVDTNVAKINMTNKVVISTTGNTDTMPTEEDNSVVVSGKQNIKLSTVDNDIIVTAKKNVKLTATDDDVEVTAKDNVKLTATEEDVEVTANKNVKLTATTEKIQLSAEASDVEITGKKNVKLTATDTDITGTAGKNVTFQAGSDSKATMRVGASGNEKTLIELSSTAIDISAKAAESDVNIDAARDINLDSGRNVNIDTGRNINASATHDIVADAGNLMKLSAPGSMMVMGAVPGQKVQIKDDDNNVIEEYELTNHDAASGGDANAKGGTRSLFQGGLFLWSDTDSPANPGGLQIGNTWSDANKSVTTVHLTSNGMMMNRSAKNGSGKVYQPGMYAEGIDNATELENQYKTHGNQYATKVGMEDVVVTATEKNGGFIALNAAGAADGANEAAKRKGGTPSITLSGKTGVITASRMEVTTVRKPSDNTQIGAVRSTTTVSYNAAGQKNSGSTTTANAQTFTLKRTDDHPVSAITYETHGDNDLVNLSYAVDPAFVSVMNDIRLTSRGGARLSEILPNYITKGIYELRNTYVKGPWPCSKTGGTNNSPGCTDANTMCADCKHELPKDIIGDGSTTAGYGFEGFLNCEVIDPNSTDHGTCSESDHKITINLGNSYYVEGEGIAHPFMGVVPAPGRRVTTKSGYFTLESGTDKTAEDMAAYDEGSCPNGYTALMSVTPASFSIGGVWGSYSDQSDAGGWMASFGDAAAVANSEQIIQGGNIMGVTNLAIKESSATNAKTLGWAIAMSTVAAGGDGEATYYWNYGGTVYTNTITAYVTTYCYYNPSFFTLPNMKIDTTTGLLTPMDGVDDTTTWNAAK